MQDTPFDQHRLGLHPFLGSQIRAQEAERKLRDMEYALWLVLKVAGPVNIPRTLICKLPSDKATLTKTELPDGSVTMQAD